MQIIQASKEQLPIVQELAYKIWPDAYSEILSEAQLDYMLGNFYALPALEEQFDNGHVFLLAEEAGVFYGFAAYELNCKNSQKAKLHKIYILPNTQGKGIGKLLLDKVESRARAAKNTHLFLNVNKYNKAQSFYEKQEFTIISEEVIPIGNDYVMDDYVMGERIVSKTCGLNFFYLYSFEMVLENWLLQFYSKVQLKYSILQFRHRLNHGIFLAEHPKKY